MYLHRPTDLLWWFNTPRLRLPYDVKPYSFISWSQLMFKVFWFYIYQPCKEKRRGGRAATFLSTSCWCGWYTTASCCRCCRCSCHRPPCWKSFQSFPCLLHLLSFQLQLLLQQLKLRLHGGLGLLCCSTHTRQLGQKLRYRVHALTARRGGGGWRRPKTATPRSSEMHIGCTWSRRSGPTSANCRMK